MQATKHQGGLSEAALLAVSTKGLTDLATSAAPPARRRSSSAAATAAAASDAASSAVPSAQRTNQQRVFFVLFKDARCLGQVCGT